MILTEKLDALIEQRGINKNKLAKMADIPYSTIDGLYKKGYENMRYPTLKKLSDFFGVTMEFLGNDSLGFDDAPTNKKSALTDRAQKVAKQYDGMDAHGQEAVDGILNIEVARMEHEKGEKKPDNSIVATLPMWTISDYETTTLPLLSQSRSAGFGDFSDDDTTEDCTVRLTDTTRRADYLIKVNGDSMEPDYPDGCTVAVKHQESVNAGEVGVFISSGNSYIKRCRENCLESINPNYEYVVPDENTICRGLVLGVI